MNGRVVGFGGDGLASGRIGVTRQSIKDRLALIPTDAVPMVRACAGCA